MTTADLTSLSTPVLLLDEAKMMRNITRLEQKAQSLGVSLRPHMKTAKSLEVGARMFGEAKGPITVSTLKEAEVYAGAGYPDILYAVGIAPSKLPRLQALAGKGTRITVILDNLAQAQAVAGSGLSAMIEIDSDGHRAGLSPEAPELPEIARVLHEGGALRGVMTHGGESYTVIGADAHAAFAEMERSACLRAAGRLVEAGLPCPVVSTGSTPTAHGARDLTGVTELRAGVYMFFDLVMAGIGVCRLDDIAASVLTTVIGHQKDKGWILCDAGWMAMSRDRGTAVQALDQGYGVVCDASGQPITDLILSGASQEHGVISRRKGSGQCLPQLPVGTLLRILPNHACATAAQYSCYHVLPENGGPIEIWSRFGGW